MEPGEEIAEVLDECMALLDENINVLHDIEYSLESEKEDALIDNMSKHDLIDMAHEVADTSRIKKAESKFVKRLFESS